MKITEAYPSIRYTKLYESLDTSNKQSALLWENAGRAIKEAELTGDQVTQLFTNLQSAANDAGVNRTGIGKAKDTAVAVNNAYKDLKSKIYNSGPLEQFAAKYDKAAAELKDKLGGDDGAVMKSVQKYRDFAEKHPIIQGALYTTLIAAAGITGAGAGGAAALALFKLVDQMVQGKDIRSAIYSAGKTGAMAYGASKLGDLIKGGGDAAAPDLKADLLKGEVGTSINASGYTIKYDYDQALAKLANPSSIGKGDNFLEIVYDAAATGATDGNAMGKTFGTAVETYAKAQIEKGLTGPELSSAVKEFATKVASQQRQALQDLVDNGIETVIDPKTFTKMMEPGMGNQSLKLIDKAISRAMGESATGDYAWPLTESQVRNIVFAVDFAYSKRLDEGPFDAIKGAIGAAMSKAVEKGAEIGTEFTQKYTAKKMMAAWEKAGKPTDSVGVLQVLLDLGIDEAVINAAFKTSGLDAPTAGSKDKKPEDEKTADADPGAKPAVAKGTAQVGDTVTYTNAKGDNKQAVVNAMLDTKDADGDAQIQLKIGNAVFAVDQKAIKSIDKSAPKAAAQPSTKVKPLVATITADPKLKAAVLAALQAA
jgi:hypothetical protein